MRRTKSFVLYTVVCLFMYNGFSFGQFVDNFEYYFPDQQVACQKPEYWTTWDLTPCDSVEDPYLSSNYSYSGAYSVVILPNDDLVKLINEPLIASISFEVYIPTGKAGYFNLMSGFAPDPNQWAMECYFDVDGTGRLIHGITDNFSWTPDAWHSVYIGIDMISDVAYFYFDGTEISSWQWSQGGIINLQVEAIDFFGATVNNEMYFDDLVIWDGCLSCQPPNPAYNLTVEEIFSADPALKLNWENNSMFKYAFYIIRKNGYPNDPGNYQYVGSTSPSVMEYIDSLITINQRYSYGVVTYGRYGYSDTSNFVTILVEPTPVELISFSIEINLQNDVVLTWSTATETNNKGFEIQRSEIRSPVWQDIEFVNGNGTTTEQNTYSFTDKNVASGKYQYRLKQTDFDGTFKYSDIVEIELAPASFSLSQNFPNPFNPTTNIEYQFPNREFVSLKVYDVLGNEVATLVNEEKTAGSYSVNFDASKLSSGIYFYKLSAGNFIQTRKMIFLK